MKIAHCLILSMLASAALMIRASADSSDADNSPQGELDPDGIPLSVTHPQKKQLTNDELEAFQKLQTKAALDKDWLLRAYEQQRQLHTAERPSNESDDLYSQLSSNKELANLAGLPTLDSGPQEQTPGFRTGGTDSNRSGVALRADSAPTANGAQNHPLVFKPLITPLGAADAAGLHDFYATLPATASPSLLPGSSTPEKVPEPEPREEQDPTAIETPGMIAAENDPLMDKGSSNLTLDMLAYDSLAQADLPHDNTPTPVKLELPLPTNAALVHKAQEVALSVPGVVKPAAAAPVRVNPLLLQDPNEPTPIDKMPQPNLIHGPIADPRDIFYR